MRYAFKKARALRINNLETDELEVRLVDLKTVTWTNGQETVYAEGTDGAKLAAFDNNKVSTLKATNGTVDTGYLAMAVGADEEVIQNGSEISLCEIYKVTNATKITLNFKQFFDLTLCNSANGGKACVYRLSRHLLYGKTTRI